MVGMWIVRITNCAFGDRWLGYPKGNRAFGFELKSTREEAAGYSVKDQAEAAAKEIWTFAGYESVIEER